MSETILVPLTEERREWTQATLLKYWGSFDMMSRWRWFDLRELPALIALYEEQPVGIATYCFLDDECELITLNSFRENAGVGEALLYGVRDIARAAGAKRLCLTTANSNLRALQFYQKRDMAIVSVHRFAIDEARKRHPTIPLFDENGIPLRDELELEMVL